MRPSSIRRVLAVIIVLLIVGVLGYAGYKATDYDAPTSKPASQQALADKLKSDSDKKAAASNKSKPVEPNTTNPVTPPSASPDVNRDLPATASLSAAPELVNSGPGQAALISTATGFISAMLSYAYILIRR